MIEGKEEEDLEYTDSRGNEQSCVQCGGSGWSGGKKGRGESGREESGRGKWKGEGRKRREEEVMWSLFYHFSTFTRFHHCPLYHLMPHNEAFVVFTCTGGLFLSNKICVATFDT
jgi:hypothetical protein